MTLSLSERIRSRLPGASFIRGVAVLTGGTALAQGLGVIVAPLLTRIYLPEELGQFGLYVAFFSMASVVMALRYEAAIVGAADRSEAADLVVIAIVLGIPTGLLSVGALRWLISDEVLGFGALPNHAALLVLPALLVTNGFTTLRYWFVREEKFEPVSRAIVLQGGGRAATQVGVGLAFGGWLGLPVGDLLGRSLGVRRLWRSAWPTVRKTAFPLQLGRIRTVLRTHRKFPGVLMPSAILNQLAINIPLPFIVYLYGPVAGGYFALVQRVVSLPMSVLGASVADVFHARVGTYARDAPHKTRRAFERTALTLLLIGFVPAFVLLAFGEVLFGFIFGDTWVEAGLLASVMAPWALAQLVVSPLSRVILVFRGQERKLLYDGFSLLATIAVFVVSSQRDMPLAQAVMLLSLANVAAYVLYYFLIADLVRKAANQP